jgi:hypothetical protein
MRGAPIGQSTDPSLASCSPVCAQTSVSAVSRMPRRTHSAHRTRGPALAGIVFAASVVLLSPMTSGVGVHTGPESFSFSPPYWHARSQIGIDNFRQNCLSNAGFRDRPAADARTGNISVRLFAWSKACVQGYSYSAAGANMGFSGPNFTIAQSGVRNVSFDWNLSWTATLTASPNASYALAQAQIYLVDFVYDVTNASYVGYEDSVFFWQESETNGTMHLHERAVMADVWSWVNLTAGDEYQLQSNFYVYLNTYSDPGTTAFGAFNMGYLGTGGQLAAMSIVGVP